MEPTAKQQIKTLLSVIALGPLGLFLFAIVLQSDNAPFLALVPSPRVFCVAILIVGAGIGSIIGSLIASGRNLIVVAGLVLVVVGVSLASFSLAPEAAWIDVIKTSEARIAVGSVLCLVFSATTVLYAALQHQKAKKEAHSDPDTK